MAHSALLTLGVCLAVAACLGVTSGGSQTGAANNLKTLCANSEQLHLRRSSQIKALALELDTASLSTSDCPPQTVLALRDLSQLLDQNKNNVCSLEATDRIRNYYDTYISSTLAAKAKEAGQKTTGGGEVPRALRNFFLGYGLQVSSLCKRNMISSLMYESEHVLNPHDHELIEPWTNEESLISQLISDPNDYDDILLPRDISQVLMETHSNEQQPEGADTKSSADSGKIFMQTQTGTVIRRMKAVCQRRFKPIYEQLILPLLYLSNMGFNYKGEELERELREMSLNKELHQWYRIVYLCESLEGLELVEDPDDAERNEGMDRRLVRILSADEAATIRERKHDTSGLSDDRDQELLKDLPQIAYSMPEGLSLEDEIINESNRNLMKLIDSFATHKTELDRIKSKVIHKMTKFLINKLKHGQLNVAFSAIFNGLMRGDDSQSEPSSNNANLQVIEALDSYVDEMYNPDKAVAGGEVAKLGKRYYQQFTTMGAQDYKAMGKTAKNKLTIRRGFWYTLAMALFIGGLVVCFG